jgi:Ni,Fe-hydrogenase III large subunit/Ni,Fe-hydrogenase III component G
MSPLADIVERNAAVERHRPWRRAVVSRDDWILATLRLAEGKATLVSLWGDAIDGDRGCVHMALRGEDDPDITVLTTAVEDGRFPSVARTHPPAQRLERTIRDFFGYTAEGAPDPRRWLDHGQWPVAAPLGAATAADPRPATEYRFLPIEGESLHQIPVGPVHAGIIEPGHFRFTCNGEAVVRLEERLGYVHKGHEALMQGADLAQGARIAGRVSGDSTVAFAWAFARAAEAALGIEAPERALWLRALMAELERIANHFGDIGAICNDATFTLIHAHCGVLREETLRAAHACFGHRLMMDRIVPGGIAQDIAPEGAAAITRLLRLVRRRFPELIAVYDGAASLQDRTVTTGIVKPELVRRFGAGGHVGRASGRAFDSRKLPGYAPYDKLRFEVPVRHDGDVNARVWIRVREIEQSVALIEQIADGLPAGSIAVAPPAILVGDAEGAAMVEAFRGDALVWLRLDPETRIRRCHLRDASWFQWPLLEAAIEGNIVADFPLCNKSFNCSYSGQDL